MSLIWLIIIIAMGVGLVLLMVKQNQSAAPTPNPADAKLERTLFTLQMGDIVQHFDRDWLVAGKLLYDDQGFQWLEYLLEDNEHHCWLAINEDDTVEVSLLTATSQLEIGLYPPKDLNYEGEAYTLVESGTATMTRQGSTLNRQAETCQYYDYRGPGRKVLSIEDWDGDLEVTAGERITPSMLRLLPGAG